MSNEPSEQGRAPIIFPAPQVRQKQTRPEPHKPALAKLTRPVLNRIHPRQRLFDALDAARSHPVIWVAAPGGAGKTTLIASYLEARNISPVWCQLDAGDNDIASFFYYLGLAVPQKQAPLPVLTPEYALGLPTFSRNFFREFFSRLETPGVLVLDDYHEVAADSGLHELLKHGLDEVPMDINVIIVSRTEPPAAFSGLCARSRLTTMAWDVLQFTQTESGELAAVRLYRRPDESAVKTLYVRTQGWAAGMVLMLEHAHTAFDAPQFEATQNPTIIFDYFASEIFRHADPELQRFLLLTAFLPKIPITVAQRLGTTTDAESILQDLTRRNFFTVRRSDACYEYHPLFRDFLTTQARVHLTAEEMCELQKKSATLLAESGETETAISLLRLAQDWPALESLALRQAPTMIGQGRHQTLREWFQYIPRSSAERNPWIKYWLGICDLPFDQALARHHLEPVFALSVELGNRVLSALTWSAIIQSYMVELVYVGLEKWLNAYEQLLNDSATSLPSEIELNMRVNYFNALSFCRPADPGLPALVSELEMALPGIANPNEYIAVSFTLLQYCFVSGEWARAGKLLREDLQHSAAPMAQINWLAWRAYYRMETGAFDLALNLVEEGLALATSAGIHAMDCWLLGFGTLAAHRLGHFEQSRQYFVAMQGVAFGSAPLRYGFHLFVSAIIGLENQEIMRASEEADESVWWARSNGHPLGEMASLLVSSIAWHKRGGQEEARARLECARKMAQDIGNRFVLFSADLIESNWTSNHALLRKALASGRAIDMSPPVWSPRADIAALFVEALENGIEVEYVQAMIRRLKLLPPVGALPENWPWPIRIHTLGRFVLTINDQPLVTSGKAQKKPLELLKALVALGGREVPASALIDALWPDPEADGKNLFENTLFRLRKLLGRDDALIMQDGKLTLNPQLAWVDVWAFERLLGQAQGIQTDKTQKALRFYQGHFLAREEERPWHLPLRGRLASKFMRHVMQLGLSWESSQLWEEAIALYQRVIELDHLAENIYRQLMHCYLQQGNHAEALNIYRRCREMLSIILSIQPSAETEALHQQILQRQL